jgi:hypothetical protein
MGGSEIAFMHEGKRTILTVTYKGEGGGSILFHQTSWDPVFLQDIDPEAPLVLEDQLQGQAGSLLSLLACDLQHRPAVTL